MGLPHPFEVLDVFGGKSKSKAARAFIFGTKWVPNEVNNWWKFGVNISNHFWDIQFWKFLSFKVPSPWYKNNFQKLFYTTVRALWKIKMFKIEYLKSGLTLFYTSSRRYIISRGGHFVPTISSSLYNMANMIPKWQDMVSQYINYLVSRWQNRGVARSDYSQIPLASIVTYFSQ